MSKNINSVKSFGTKYFKKDLFRKAPVVKTMRYNEKHLQIARDCVTGEIVRLDLTDAFRMVIVGASGSGKTFSIRSLVDRLALLDKSIIHLNDPKNEFVSSHKPVQAKFRGGLLEGEKPAGLKIATLRPTFFKKITPELAYRNHWYSFDMRHMSEGDFGSLLGSAANRNANQRIAFDIIYEKLQKEYKRDKNFKFDLNWVENIIDGIDELGTQSKNTIKFKFRPMEKSKFFMEKYQHNIPKLMAKGYIPAINMENFDSFSKGNALNYPLTTLSVIHRQVIDARRKGLIKPLVIVFDEVTRFVNNKDDTEFKAEVLSSVGLNRRYNISYVFAPQVLSDLPVEILKQANYLFVPASADSETIKKVLVDSGMTRNVQVARNDAMRLKRKMKRYPYSWVAIDMKRGTRTIVQFLNPLSWHMETSQ